MAEVSIDNADRLSESPLGRLYEHFDPTGRFSDNPEGLLEELLEVRQGPVDTVLVRGIGHKALEGTDNESFEKSGKELLMHEIIHLDIVSEDGYVSLSSFLDVDIGELKKLRQEQERKSEDLAGKFGNYITDALGDEQNREKYSQLLHVPIYEGMPPLVFAGMILSAAVHEGEKRKNGNLPYATHPFATAALYQMAINKLDDKAPDLEHVNRQIFCNLMHDSIEKIIGRGKSSIFNGDTTVISPLFMRKILEGLGEPSPKDMVDDIMRVTKSRGTDGRAAGLAVYIDKANDTIRSTIMKLSDLFHNHIIDPKNPQVEHDKTTSDEYEVTIPGLIDAMEGFLDKPGVDAVGEMKSIAESYRGRNKDFLRAVSKLRFGVL